MHSWSISVRQVRSLPNIFSLLKFFAPTADFLLFLYISDDTVESSLLAGAPQLYCEPRKHLNFDLKNSDPACHTNTVPDPDRAVLRIQIRDSGWVQDPDPGSGMNIPYHSSENLEIIFGVKILKFFDADADSGIFLALHPGWKKFGSGINFPDPQHWEILLPKNMRIRIRRNLILVWFWNLPGCCRTYPACGGEDLPPPTHADERDDQQSTAHRRTQSQR